MGRYPTSVRACVCGLHHHFAHNAKGGVLVLLQRGDPHRQMVSQMPRSPLKGSLITTPSPQRPRWWNIWAAANARKGDGCLRAEQHKKGAILDDSASFLGGAGGGGRRRGRDRSLSPNQETDNLSFQLQSVFFLQREFFMRCAAVVLY